MDPAWQRFAVDGEPFYWRTYPSKTCRNNGPWEPVETLDVTRIPDTPGIGRVLPAGTVVTEQDALDLVRLFKDDGREIP
jgi:hypothetical protein